jgi:hypothetical protein
MVDVYWCDLPYLYHTTFIRSNHPISVSYFKDEFNENYPKPEMGKYSTHLGDKFFSIADVRHYADRYEAIAMFLRYRVKRPLLLMDVRDNDEIRGKIHNGLIKDIDGYFGIDLGEFPEVFLINAANCVDPVPTELPFKEYNPLLEQIEEEKAFRHLKSNKVMRIYTY